MGRPQRWSEGLVDRGVVEIRLNSWKYFSDYVNQELLDYTTYIYRGHADATWLLEPTLDRLIKSPVSPLREGHLERFKYETRGRRGPHPPVLENDNDWWALGQHHGLATPLLDWTESPFVALYFAAFAALATQHANAHHIAVYAMSQSAIARRNTKIQKDNEVPLINDRKPTVKIVRPQSNENSRLVGQRGLFTRGPNNVDLETWVRTHGDPAYAGMELIKLVIPALGLQDCLRYLNRMNINHSTLLPDLLGASEFCNRHLMVSKY
ncbi:MAG TPA: FRG domain-containing protein [Polyangiaceae bacterium]|nr:FRG domain-containing protein [Polyangiaceae bacterium]